MSNELKLATMEDIPSLMPLCKEFQEHHVPDFEIDVPKLSEMFAHYINNQPKTHMVLVLVDGDKVVGFLASHVGDHPFMKMKMACEMAWWVSPAYRGRGSIKLLDAYEYWSSRVGADVAQLSTPPLGEHDKLSKLYSKYGYTQQEQVYLKRLK